MTKNVLGGSKTCAGMAGRATERGQGLPLLKLRAFIDFAADARRGVVIPAGQLGARTPLLMVGRNPLHALRQHFDGR